MPKQIDPVTRRLDVVNALFRVVVRDGLQHASLRTVANEAQLNIGSLADYFASQRELMRFAMRSMLDRATARLHRRIDEMGDLRALPRSEQLRCKANLLAELLPLDDLAHESAAGTRASCDECSPTKQKLYDPTSRPSV